MIRRRKAECSTRLTLGSKRILPHQRRVAPLELLMVVASVVAVTVQALCSRAQVQVQVQAQVGVLVADLQQAVVAAVEVAVQVAVEDRSEVVGVSRISRLQAPKTRTLVTIRAKFRSRVWS